MGNRLLKGAIIVIIGIILPASFLFSASDVKVQITQFEVNELPNFSLYVSVTDNAGKPVPLPADALKIDSNLIRVLEDQVESPILDVKPVIEIEESEVGHFNIALVMDNSSSILPYAKKIKEAADQFIDQLRPVDKAAIIAFDKNYLPYKAKVKQQFTNIKSVLKGHTEIDRVTERTFLYDALFVACLNLRNERTLGRKAIVVLSDGKDIGSKANLKHVIAFAKSEDIPVYAIDFSRSRKNRNLRNLSSQTQGKYFYARNVKQVSEVYQSILKQLQGLYRVTYRSLNENWSSAVRNLQVEINLNDKIYIGRRPYYPDVAKLKYLALRYKEVTTHVSSTDYQKYLNSFPASEWSNDIRFRLGVYYEQRGMYDKALEVYDELENQSDQSWVDDVYFRKGKIYENTGKYGDAIQMYSELVKNYPEEKSAPEALLGMARSYRGLNNVAESEKIYNQLKEEYGGSEVTDEALFELSNLKIQQNRLAEAKQDLLELVDKYKESNTTPEAYLSLATLAEKEGALDEAIEYCDRAAQLPTKPEVISRALTRKGDLLFQKGDLDEAVYAYEAVVNNYKGNGFQDEALLGMAKSFRGKNDYLAMRKSFDEIRQMKAHNQEITFDLDQENSIVGVIPPNQAKMVSTLSGAALETMPEKTNTFPLQVSIKPIATPEQFKNFSIAGRIYDFKANVDTFLTPVKISLPYEESWFDTTGRKAEDFKIYTYDGANWKLIPGCKVDSVNQAVCAEISSLSWKTLMFQPPRVIRFNDILFAFNSSELNDAYRAKMDTIVQILLDSPKIRLEVQGHTDSIGTEEVNQKLSQKRAETIRKYMLQSGIDSSRVMAKGFGERFPIASNNAEAGRALNRRTEFVIVSKGENDIIDVQQRQLGTKYTIELGAGYGFLGQATEQSEVLKKEGFQVSIVPDQTGDGIIYRLFCGYFDNVREAEQFARKITSQFLQLTYKIVERK
ncbi:MAG: tetratricopeptide repeat protein [Calditrichaeota bacterium]|nr:tetratricopeptide repeat protein [Calditrichota bacterium]